jgi:sec-independent protein translocase protein TatA
MVLLLDTFLMQIGGTEWLIIILVGIFLLFGSKKLPELSRTLGKAAGEYEKAKNLFRTEIENATRGEEQKDVLPQRYVDSKITALALSERHKLEEIASTIGIDHTGKTDDELRTLISEKMKGL